MSNQHDAAEHASRFTPQSAKGKSILEVDGLTDYHSSITANITPEEAIERISHVSDWWTNGFKGNSEKIGDTFTVKFGETFVDFKIVEVVPNRKIVWLVTDCNLHWIRNKTEWKDTKVVWELTPEDGETRISMTHIGLIPRAECFNNCKAGWDFYVGESLLRLLTEGKGLPDGRRNKSSIREG
jgi:hypothetical protein